MVPWLVAIPASLFSGFLSDHLISQGEPWGQDLGEPCLDSPHCGRGRHPSWEGSHSDGKRPWPLRTKLGE